MSVKDVQNYYNQITNDYMEMVDTLKELEELEAQNIVNPDKVEEIRKLVEPLKINYQRISWIMYLLNQPNRKEKKPKYNNSMKNKMASIDPNKENDGAAIHKENKAIIGALNDTWAGTAENK